MNLKKLILNSIFLAIGFILHQITPPIFLGVKPDFLLTMLFIAIVLSDDYKMTLILGITAGLLTAATTGFPGGQIPNFVDKVITAHFIYLLNKILGTKINDRLKILIINISGTIVSGIIFLITANILVGLPAEFSILVTAVVIPATLINTVVGFILYKVVKISLRYSV